MSPSCERISGYSAAEFMADSDLVYYEPGAGMLFPERCVVAQLDAAREAGAMLRTGEQMLHYEAVPGGVRVTTDKGVYEAAEAVLAAGAWSPGFAPTPSNALPNMRMISDDSLETIVPSRLSHSTGTVARPV